MTFQKIKQVGNLLVKNYLPNGWKFKICDSIRLGVVAHCFYEEKIIGFNFIYCSALGLTVETLEKIILHEIAHCVNYNHGKEFTRLCKDMGGYFKSKLPLSFLK